MKRHARTIVRILVITATVAAGLVSSVVPVSAATATFSGFLDAAGTSWRAHTFDVVTGSTINAVLDWDNASANLNMFLYDPSGTLVAMATSTTQKPETITYPANVSGKWKLGVKAKTGSANYTLTVDGVAETAPAYLSILFGRTQWVSAANCKQLPNTITLQQVADALQQRGIAATGNVVVDRTLETGLFCMQGYVLHPGWDKLATLRDSYGWSFVSAGATYGDMTQMNAQQQWDESCGSLQAFVDHGHNNAWGLFAYPGNAYTTEIQTNVVSTCFAYGRVYGAAVNVRSKMKAPWFQKTSSINGGACNDSSLPCYSLSGVGVNRRYTLPSRLLQLMTAGPDQWAVVQMYRFVSGSHSGGQNWDCTSSDPADHWTNRAELYCWSDFLWAVDRIPAGTTVTDPATVATAWGRSPG
jgi:hypothetical protein